MKFGKEITTVLEEDTNSGTQDTITNNSVEMDENTVKTEALSTRTFCDHELQSIEDDILVQLECLHIDNNKAQEDIVSMNVDRTPGFKLQSNDNDQNTKVTNATDIAMELIDTELNCCNKQYHDIFTVNLSHQDINFVQESMSQKLTNLTVLDLSHNKLSELPDFLNFKVLKELDISHNNFESMPLCLQVHFCKLVKLDISHNKIKTLHKPRCTHTLQTFSINHNIGMKIPEWFWYQEFLCLKELNMSSTDPFFEHLPIWLLNHMELKENGVFSNLISLHMQNTAAVMSNVSQLKYLKNIKYLNCSNDIDHRKSQDFVNVLWELPLSILYLSSIQELHLSNVQLNCIPEDIGNLICLEKLNISHNKVYKLPESFANLKSLKILDVSYNKLTMLPDGFVMLSNLTTFYAQHNDLPELPIGFETLNLVHCDLYDNELGEKSVSVVKHMKCLKRLDMMQNYINQELLPLNLQVNLRSSLPTLEERTSDHKIMVDQDVIDYDFEEENGYRMFRTNTNGECYSCCTSQSGLSSSISSFEDSEPSHLSAANVDHVDLDISNWDDENEWQTQLPKTYEEAIEKFRTRQNATYFIPSDTQVKYFNKRKQVKKFDFLSSRPIVDGQFDSA
ncbi:hypothetical protein M8J75_001613 [Diaphorina citri]|nr:hypothetical protein M8J75_001613 [Diaphorina citri]